MLILGSIGGDIGLDFDFDIAGGSFAVVFSSAGAGLAFGGGAAAVSSYFGAGSFMSWFIFIIFGLATSCIIFIIGKRLKTLGSGPGDDSSLKSLTGDKVLVHNDVKAGNIGELTVMIGKPAYSTVVYFRAPVDIKAGSRVVITGPSKESPKQVEVKIVKDDYTIADNRIDIKPDSVDSENNE